MSEEHDCGDSGCIMVDEHKGMRTNGGCRCALEHRPARQRILALLQDRQRLRALIADADSRLACNNELRARIAELEAERDGYSADALNIQVDLENAQKRIAELEYECSDLRARIAKVKTKWDYALAMQGQMDREAMERGRAEERAAVVAGARECARQCEQQSDRECLTAFADAIEAGEHLTDPPPKETPYETAWPEGVQWSIRAELEREVDGRWIAAVPSLPGVTAYGTTREEAQLHVTAIALSVLAERVDPPPSPWSRERPSEGGWWWCRRPGQPVAALLVAVEPDGVYHDYAGDLWHLPDQAEWCRAEPPK